MQKYSAGIVSYNDLYIQMKKAATILLKNNDFDVLYDKIVNQDVLSLVSERNRKRTAGELKRRLSYLDHQMLLWLSESDTNTSHHVNLAALLLNDRAFREFMEEVYCDSNLKFKQVITEIDFNHFFSLKAENSEIVANWTDAVRRRLGNEYRNTLEKAGYGKKEKKDFLINVPYVKPELIDYLKKIDMSYIAKLICGGTIVEHI